MKYTVTYEFESEQDHRLLLDKAQGRDARARVKSEMQATTPIRVTVHAREKDPPIPPLLELTRRVSDLTVGELFELLDVTIDLEGRTRKMEKRLHDERQDLLHKMAMVIESTQSCSVAPEAIASAKELMEWAERMTPEFTAGFGTKELLVLYAWNYTRRK